MRAIAIKAADSWSGQPADRVVLDYDDRHRRRIAMTGNKGTAFLLDLPLPAELRGGDALLLEDGRLVEVVAAPELLLEIRCADARHLARIAWHIGNRHVPVQVLSDALRIRREHVLADMARQLGGNVVEIEAPVTPEGGAYQSAHAHAREHVSNAPARPAISAKARTEPSVSFARGRGGRNRAPRSSGALSPDDVAVASLSGRRIFLFQRHRVGGRGRRYQRRRNAAPLARSHAARRRRSERWHFLQACLSRSDGSLRWSPCRGCGACGRLRADPRALSRNDRHGPRVSRGDASGLAMSDIRHAAAALDRAGRLSDRGCRGLCRSRRAARCGVARVLVRGFIQLGFRGHPPHPARTYGRPAHLESARAHGNDNGGPRPDDVP